MSKSSPPFRRAQASLSIPWMAPVRRPMLQQGPRNLRITSKQYEMKNLLGSYRIAICPLPRRSRRPRRLLRGGGELATQQCHLHTREVHCVN
jgi:hypothetical protein